MSHAPQHFFMSMTPAQQAAQLIAAQQQQQRAIAQQRALAEQRALAKLDIPAMPPPQTNGAAPFIERRRATLDEHDKLFQRSEWMNELFCSRDERPPRRGRQSEEELQAFAAKRPAPDRAREDVAALRADSRRFEETVAEMRRSTSYQQLAALMATQETDRGARVHFRPTMCLPLQLAVVPPNSSPVPSAAHTLTQI